MECLRTCPTSGFFSFFARADDIERAIGFSSFLLRASISTLFVYFCFFFVIFFAAACFSCLPTRTRPRPRPDSDAVDSVAVALAACRHGSQIVFMTGRLEKRVLVVLVLPARAQSTTYRLTVYSMTISQLTHGEKKRPSSRR